MLKNEPYCLFQKFDAAANNVKNLKSKPSDNDLLELYGLFKQATVGDADAGSEYYSFMLFRHSSVHVSCSVRERPNE
jgi:acyl-CoA-binding protein